MELKILIGQRIRAARAKADFTLQEVAERSGVISIARLNNWELGKRMPRPNEINQIAKILKVSSAYLYGFTNTSQPNQIVPLLETKEITAWLKSGKWNSEFNEITIDSYFDKPLSKNAFALLLDDDSMSPQFPKGSYLIFDPAIEPHPGEYVLAEISKQKKFIFRKHVLKNENKTGHAVCELIPLNEHWPSTQIKNASDGKIVAALVEHRYPHLLAR